AGDRGIAVVVLIGGQLGGDTGTLTVGQAGERQRYRGHVPVEAGVGHVGTGRVVALDHHLHLVPHSGGGCTRDDPGGGVDRQAGGQVHRRPGAAAEAGVRTRVAHRGAEGDGIS